MRGPDFFRPPPDFCLLLPVFSRQFSVSTYYLPPATYRFTRLSTPIDRALARSGTPRFALGLARKGTAAWKASLRSNRPVARASCPWLAAWKAVLRSTAPWPEPADTRLAYSIQLFLKLAEKAGELSQGSYFEA